MNFHIYTMPINSVIAITMIGLISWTIVYAGIDNTQEGKIRLIWRLINGGLAIVALIMVLNYTLINRAADGIHTMPFIRSFEYIKEQPELIREMIMNAFLFFPFGLTMPYALCSTRITEKSGKKYLPVFITIIAALLLSIGIELIQHLYNFGNAELSDIIMNALGAAIGTVSYGISRKLLN